MTTTPPIATPSTTSSTTLPPVPLSRLVDVLLTTLRDVHAGEALVAATLALGLARCGVPGRSAGPMADHVVLWLKMHSTAVQLAPSAFAPRDLELAIEYAAEQQGIPLGA